MTALPEWVKTKDDYAKWRRGEGPTTKTPTPIKAKTPELSNGHGEDFNLRKLSVGKKWALGVVSWLIGMVAIIMVGPFDASVGDPATLGALFMMFYPVVFFLLIKKRSAMIINCPNCKYGGTGKKHTKGSLGVEVLLWLCLFIPGLIYSAWRCSNKIIICPQCNFENVVKLGVQTID